MNREDIKMQVDKALKDNLYCPIEICIGVKSRACQRMMEALNVTPFGREIGYA